MAIAPTVGAALATSVGGYPALFILLAGTSVVSGALALAARPVPKRPAVADASPAPAPPSG